MISQPQVDHSPGGFLCPVWGRWLAVLCGLGLLVWSGRAASYRPPEPDPFHRPGLLRVEVVIPESGLDQLRAPRRSSRGEKPRTLAMVRAEGEVFTNVSVQLKGFSSYEGVDARPSLTLDFEEHAPRQRFFGLKKISLNNSSQDETRLHEKLSREIFAAAGVPVPRSDLALVTLNGRDLGAYVLVEGFNSQFLRRHFGKANGTFFEPGVLSDLDRPMRSRTLGDSPAEPILARVLKAAREPDPARRWASLQAAVDVERFLAMMAVETLLCHSDSYSMNRNNYRLYHDPASDRLVFLPHGMDRILGTHRSNLELPLVPPALGLVARAILELPEGRRRYAERVGQILTNQLQGIDWCGRIQATQARLKAWKVEGTRPATMETGTLKDGDELCRRLQQRLAEAQFQMQDVQWWHPAPRGLADTNGVMPLPPWRLKRTAAQPLSGLSTRESDEGVALFGNPALGEVKLKTTLRLPPGQYRLHGEIRVVGAEWKTNSATFSSLRYSGARFDVEQSRARGTTIYQNFTVGSAPAPEEVEFQFSFNTSAPELRVDFSKLELRFTSSPAPSASSAPGKLPGMSRRRARTL